MICPSCSEQLSDSVKHCVHCGIAITRRSVQMARIANNCAWVARRSLGGFFAGALGWLFTIAVSRVKLLGSAPMEASFADLLGFFPGQSAFTTAVAGCFLGTVGGMIERSAYKSFLGGILGAIGGVLAGFLFPYLQNMLRGNLYEYSFSLSASWAVTGMMVGFASGLLEGTKSKILAGMIGGLVGGALGGGVGSQIYGALLMELGGPGQWVTHRMLESLAGGIVGVHLWFCLGLTEKLYIFRRRQMLESSAKTCDFCHSENTLNSWYCGECGSALQVAAKREQIRVTPYRGLERVSNALQFLSWLSAITGVILAIVVFLSFLIQNFLFAVFGSLLVALLIYMLSIIFKALSETVRMGIQLTEKLNRDTSAR